MFKKFGGRKKDDKTYQNHYLDSAQSGILQGLPKEHKPLKKDLSAFYLTLLAVNTRTYNLTTFPIIF